jgi:prephenate dehydrogenase
MTIDVEQITIIGTGLLGASLAVALRKRGYMGRLAGVGRRKATLEQAAQLGCWDLLTDETTKAIDAMPSGRSQLAVIAAPLGHFEEILGKLAACDRDGLMITDVGSTKASVCEQAGRMLPRPAMFVGSHPMAGSEQQGPAAADPDLFEGKPCVLTPDSTTDPAALSLVASLWRFLNMRVLQLTPDEHDRHVAVISHLPHVMSVMLVQVAAQCGGLDVASTGFRDTTRLASSNPTIRFDILEENRAKVIEAIDAFQSALTAFRTALAQHDDAAVRDTLEQSKSTRDRWLDGQA